MRRIKKSLAMGFSFLAASAFLSSCDNTQELAPTNEISQDVKAKFTAMGYDVSDLKVDNTINPFTGERMGDFLLEGDIHVSFDALEEAFRNNAEHDLPNGEQYRTNNLVSAPRTISVIGYTGNGYALTTNMRTGLQWAINNYNRINTGLTFTLSFAASTNADIVVYNNGQPGGGGSAGFPSGGAPYKWVQINNGLGSYNNNVNEHVIGHEIGHCLGLRHTDYFNRSYSCGSGGNEGDGGVGAIHIPGTPTSYDSNSLMLACFNSGVDGEFSNFDIVALEYLY